MIPNGFIDKNGGMAFDTMNGSLHKDEMMNNFQTKIGQNMDFDLPPYNSEGNNEVAKSYPEEVFHEEIFYYPVDEVIVEECCPASIYRAMPCCAGERAPFWQVWNKQRYKCLKKMGFYNNYSLLVLSSKKFTTFLFSQLIYHSGGFVQTMFHAEFTSECL